MEPKGLDAAAHGNIWLHSVILIQYLVFFRKITICNFCTSLRNIMPAQSDNGCAARIDRILRTHGASHVAQHAQNKMRFTNPNRQFALLIKSRPLLTKTRSVLRRSAPNRVHLIPAVLPVYRAGNLLLWYGLCGLTHCAVSQKLIYVGCARFCIQKRNACKMCPMRSPFCWAVFHRTIRV